MITEGDEESGNHIDHYIEKLKERIGTPTVIFCLDSGSLDYDHLYITKSLRGYIGARVKAEVLENGVHSGDASGIVPSAYRALNMVINKIQDVNTGVVRKEFQVHIPPNRYEEMYHLVEELGDSAIKSYPYAGNTKPVSDDNLTLYINRTWKPQLTTIGMNGFPPIEEAGNVSHPWIEAKISLRTPPTLNNEVKSAEMQTILTENPPYDCNVTVTGVNYGNGWNCPDYEAWLNDAFIEAGQEYFGKKVEGQCEGGSIPLMGLLSSIWPTAQFVVTGVLGPDSNAHGPNEFLDIPYCKKLTQSMAHVVARVSDNFNKCKKK